MEEENCLYELGDLYLHGHYVKQDKSRAFSLYERSYKVINSNIENDSYGDVCLRLGKCYLAGDGVEMDVGRAEEYLSEAEKAFEYRVILDAPIDWINAASAGLDEARRLLKNIHESGAK